ncbi:hypothetical protein H0H93_001197 [Arthromyces matolae]|nr:hypothetical protein H0H93_001197 [Arthromyces matolae]
MSIYLEKLYATSGLTPIPQLSFLFVLLHDFVPFVLRVMLRFVFVVSNRATSYQAVDPKPTGLYPKMQFSIGGSRRTPFPLNIECNTQEDADQCLQLLQPIADRYGTLTPIALLQELDDSKSWTSLCDFMNTLSDQWWAVTLGDRVGIFINRHEASESINAAKPRFHRVWNFSTFQGAFTCMATGGERLIDLISEGLGSTSSLPSPTTAPFSPSRVPPTAPFSPSRGPTTTPFSPARVAVQSTMPSTPTRNILSPRHSPTKHTASFSPHFSQPNSAGPAFLETASFQRLLNSSRTLTSAKKRRPWRTRTRRRLRLTEQEKAALKRRRQEAKESYHVALQTAQDSMLALAEGLRKEFGKHSVQYYLEELVQMSRLQKKKKKTGSWQAFVSQEVTAANDKLPPGEPRKKAHMLMPQIAAKWAEMTPEEKKKQTKAKVDELSEAREMRAVGCHNVPINSFHDARVTLDTIADEVTRLNGRTGIEMICFAVRSSKEQYNPPRVIATSDRIEDFFELALKKNVYDLNLQMEAYILSGVQDEAAKAEVSRMYYHNFDTKITERYAVVVKNWPLPKFCSPSEVASRIELDILLNAWKSGTTYFHKMSHAEYTEWLESRRSDSSTATPTNDLASSSVPGTSDLPPSVPGTSNIPPSDVPDAVSTDRRPFSNITNEVTGSAGELVVVTKKARKVRSDKGVKRGKRGARVNSANDVMD